MLCPLCIYLHTTHSFSADKHKRCCCARFSTPSTRKAKIESRNESCKMMHMILWISDNPKSAPAEQPSVLLAPQARENENAPPRLLLPPPLFAPSASLCLSHVLVLLLELTCTPSFRGRRGSRYLTSSNATERPKILRFRSSTSWPLFFFFFFSFLL